MKLTFEITRDWRKQAVIIFFLNSSWMTTHHIADSWSPPSASRRPATTKAISSLSMFYDKPEEQNVAVVLAEEEEESRVVADEHNMLAARLDMEAAATRVKRPTEANTRNQFVTVLVDNMKRTTEVIKSNLSIARLELEATATRVLDAEENIKRPTEAHTRLELEAATRKTTSDQESKIADEDNIKRTTEANARNLLTARLELEAATRKKKSDDQQSREAAEMIKRTTEANARFLVTARLELEAATTKVLDTENYIKLTTDAYKRNLCVTGAYDNMKRTTETNRKNLMFARRELEAATTRVLDAEENNIMWLEMEAVAPAKIQSEGQESIEPANNAKPITEDNERTKMIKRTTENNARSLVAARLELEAATTKVLDTENYIKLTTEAYKRNRSVSGSYDNMKRTTETNRRNLMFARRELEAATTRVLDAEENNIMWLEMEAVAPVKIQSEDQESIEPANNAKPITEDNSRNSEDQESTMPSV
jgi:predicted small secreted protein